MSKETYASIQASGRREKDLLLRPQDTIDEKNGLNRKNLAVFVCLWLAYLMCSAAYSIIAPIFPREAEAKGATPILTGVIISSSPLCVVLLSPFFSYFLSHFGLRFLTFSGLLLIGGSFVLFGFVAEMSSGWIFVTFCVLLRMVEGVGSAMFITAAFTLLPLLFPNSVGTMTGLFEIAGGLGFILGPPLGGYLYQIRGFRLPFISVGSCVLVFIIPCLLLVKNIEFIQKQTFLWMVVRKLLTSPTFFVLMLANILALVSLSFFIPTIQLFLHDELNLNKWKVGLVCSSAPAVYLLSALVVRKFSERLGPRYFIVCGLILYGLGHFFVGPPEFISSPKIWITCLAFSAIGLAASLTIIPAYTDMLSEAKRHLERGEEGIALTALTVLVSGVVSSALSLGEFVGPLVGGTLTQFFCFSTASLLLSEVMFAEVQCNNNNNNVLQRYSVIHNRNGLVHIITYIVYIVTNCQNIFVQGFLLLGITLINKCTLS